MRTLILSILLALATAGCSSVPEPEAPSATTAQEQSEEQQASHRDIVHHFDRASR